MKIICFTLLIFFFAISACDKSHIEKPENLIGEKQMIDMLVDVHLAEATFNIGKYNDENMKNSSSADFYYSVLEKYQVPDSVFEKSFVYYASQIKQFERMYRQVMNRLNEMEQEFSGRKNDLLEFDDQE